MGKKKKDYALLVPLFASSKVTASVDSIDESSLVVVYTETLCFARLVYISTCTKLDSLNGS